MLAQYASQLVIADRGVLLLNAAEMFDQLWSKGLAAEHNRFIHAASMPEMESNV